MKAHYVFLLCLFACLSEQMYAQVQVRKLAPNINHPSINVSVPFINLDGNALVFLSDYSDDNKLVMNYSTRQDGVNWKDPITLPKALNNGLNYLKGYSLSPDGKTIYLTSSRSGGMGGFDMYKVEQRGNFWGDLVNMGLPFNSKGNDGCPSFSADGKSAYFMRCEKMTFENAENCKLMMTRKKANGQWDEAKELPYFVNTGNSQTPRIMGDGETLIFSSNKILPNKGGMDLYMTRWDGTIWSNPVALDFVNTPKDDQFVSATSLGRYIMKDAMGQRKSEIVEMLFPAGLKPKSTMKIEGKVNMPNAYISAYNQKDKKRAFEGRPSADGSFLVYLNEGSVYDFSIEPEQDNYTFYSREFDLTTDKFPQIEKISATLKPVAVGDVMELSGVSFKPNSYELNSGSFRELGRVARMIKGNPSRKFVIDISLAGYKEDVVQSDSDLTEIKTDTIKIPVTYTVIDTTATDSPKTMTRDSLVVNKKFHNDRTAPQGMELINYLISQGASGQNITMTHKAEPALPEKKKLTVTVSVR
jgi:Tol biopolymer transport system component